MRYLGIDFGTKKIGLALSDEAGTMGFPHTVVARHEAEALIQKIVAEQKVGAVVMGDSKDFSGQANPVAAKAKKLGEWITSTLHLTVYFEPEMLTSVEARRARDESVSGRKPKNASDVDASAAALILTSYLSRNGTK